MNRTITILISTLCVCTAANDMHAEAWSLDSCINYAITHNIDVRNQALQRQSAEFDVIAAKDRFLPTLDAGARQSFNFGRGLTSANTYANRNTTQTGWDVNLSVPLFQGLEAVRRVAYAKANLRAIAEQHEASKDDVTINVIAQYLQVLYCREMVAVAKEQAHLSTVELERRKILLEAGKIPELDLIQAQSQVAQDELAIVNAENDHTLALLDLTQLLQLPSMDGFDIQSLDEQTIRLLPAGEVYANALQHNHALRAAGLAIAAADKNISLARTGYLPRLSFSAGIGSSYYHLSGEQNPPFHRQMRDNLNKSFGFTLSIPIFDAFSTRNSVRKAKLQKLSAELDYENTCTKLYKSIQQAYHMALAAERKQKSSAIAYHATHAALEAMQEKYNYGRANATEFEQAKSEYIKAASEAVQAKYESILRMRILEFYNRN